MVAGLYDLIPGLREAEENYKREQAEAFAGVEPDICGVVSILPFTPQMFLELDGAGNAFFHKKPINPEDIAVFLWRTSPIYQRAADDLRRFFVGSLATLDYQQSALEICEYIRRSWSGRPSTGKLSTPSLGQWPSRIVHLFASEYGWSEEYILNLPFRRLWQYANRIKEERNNEYRETCPDAMALRSRWLQEQNQGRN